MSCCSAAAAACSATNKTADEQKPIMDQCSGLFVVRQQEDSETLDYAMTGLIPVTRLISSDSPAMTRKIAKGKTKYTHCPLRLKTNSTLHPAWRKSFDALTSIGSTAEVPSSPWSQLSVVKCGWLVTTSNCDVAFLQRGEVKLKLPGSKSNKSPLKL